MLLITNSEFVKVCIMSWNYNTNYTCFFLQMFLFNGTLSGLRQFLATENLLKLIKNAFYFALKAVFDLKIFKFLSCLFDQAEKRLD